MTACTGACASAWPALDATSMPTVGAGLDPSKVGSVNGQVTYAGHLLYHYAGAGAPGDTNGAGIPSWDAVSPTGALVHAH
jgi:predicted lipoprotein with Yx(FWY)xxD motif